MNYKKLQNKANKINEALEHAKRTDGTEFVRTKETAKEALADEIKDIVFNSTGRNFYQLDNGYKTLWELCDLIGECESEEALETRIYEDEGLIYTKDLTEWLNSDINNVYYLTEALEEFEPKDGFNLLQIAYCKAYQQEMFETLRELEKLV
jgi:thymidylate synthase